MNLPVRRHYFLLNCFLSGTLICHSEATVVVNEDGVRASDATAPFGGTVIALINSRQ